MIDTTYTQQLEKDGYVIAMTVGISMEPMLKQRREHLVIEKPEKPPKNNDVVLFQRKNGQYVLHRVVGKRKNIYLIRGDNCYENEKVSPQQIRGVLKGFYRGEVYTSCSKALSYRCYVVFWRLVYPFRWGYWKLKRCGYAVWVKLRR